MDVTCKERERCEDRGRERSSRKRPLRHCRDGGWTATAGILKRRPSAHVENTKSTLSSPEAKALLKALRHGRPQESLNLGQEPAAAEPTQWGGGDSHPNTAPHHPYGHCHHRSWDNTSQVLGLGTSSSRRCQRGGAYV